MRGAGAGRAGETAVLRQFQHALEARAGRAQSQNRRGSADHPAQGRDLQAVARCSSLGSMARPSPTRKSERVRVLLPSLDTRERPHYPTNRTQWPATGAVAMRQKRTWRSSACGRGPETGGNRFFRETVRRRRFARFQSRGVDGGEQKQRRVHFSFSAPPCSNRSRETNGRLPGGLPDRVAPLFPVRAPPCRG